MLAEKEHRHHRRRHRLLGFLLFLAFVGILVLGLVFGIGGTNTDSRIEALRVANAALHVELMTLTMSSVSYNVTYIQNGTCVFGFPKVAGSAAQSTADFSDYVIIPYSLKEVRLNPIGVPLSVLELGVTPRPIVFNGFTPPAPLPKFNELTPQIALWSPGVSQIDSIAQSSIALVPYSYVTASSIKLTPNCVAMNPMQHDSSHCTEESGFSPFFTASYPSPNSVSVFTNNVGTAGDGVLQFYWGQWNYGSFLNQYDFTGTTVEFTQPLDLLLVKF